MIYYQDEQDESKSIINYERKVSNMTTVEIKKMDMADRLQMMETLWDSLLDDESELESPRWHADSCHCQGVRRVLQQRFPDQNVSADPADSRARQAVWA